MEFHTSIILLSSLLLLAHLSPPLIHGRRLPVVDVENGGDPGEIRTYIVHVRKNPDATNFVDSDRELEDWHRSFLPKTALDSGEPRLVYSYRHAISGFAARLTGDEARAMGSASGSLRVVPDRRLALETTYTPAFLGLKSGSGLWERTNYGEGIVIGVVDSGILPSHPSFNDNGVPPPPPDWKGRCDFNASYCNNKIIGAKTFISGKSLPPLDGDGHGTHVASIAAGNFVFNASVLGNAGGTAAGIAPRAHLAVYRACRWGYCKMSDSLRAMDEAISDGVDVISVSLGYESQQLFEDSFSIAGFAAAEAGIVVCAAAGNRGPMKSTVENDAPWILTVGASSTDRRITSTVRLGNGMEFDGESGYHPATFNSTLLPAVYGWKCEKDELSHKNVSGKAVICWTGRSTLLAKGEAVKDAGGAAMVVLNLPYHWNTTSADVYSIAASNVKQDFAHEIANYITGVSSTTPTAGIVFKGTQFGSRPCPTIPFFSARGPSLVNGGIPKPDIVAPGLNILAAWSSPVGPDPPVPDVAAFNFQSGTSMATPHLAGVAALLKKAHPLWSPAAIKSAIMTTADELDRDKNPITDDYTVDTENATATAFAMGAGQVRPAAANHPGLVYDLVPGDYLRYLCGLGHTDDEVTDIARRTVQCSMVGNITAEQLNYPSIGVSLEPGVKKFITRTVTNVGHHNSTYLVEIERPDRVKMHVKPKMLQFESNGEKKSFVIKMKIKGKPATKGLITEGRLSWVSGERVVRSPVVVTFA